MTKQPSIFTALQELEMVLSHEMAQGVIDHRVAKRAKLTPLAARLLAREFAKLPDPNAGAEAMLINGWQGFKAEWMQPQTMRQNGTPPRGIDALRADLARRINQDELEGTTRQGSPDLEPDRRLSQLDWSGLDRPH